MWLFDVPMHHKVFSGHQNWRDNYWVHTRVMRLFGELEGTDDVRQRSGVLYRVEPGIGSGRVLVQSCEPLEDHNVRSVKLGSVLERLQPGQRVGLRVKANSVRTVNRSANGLTKRHRERLRPDEIRTWFTCAVGSALQNVEIDELEPDVERQRGVPIAVVMIDASATVLETEGLIRLVSVGIGRAKAFGCGLISVRPIPSTHRF